MTDTQHISVQASGVSGGGPNLRGFTGASWLSWRLLINLAALALVLLSVYFITAGFNQEMVVFALLLSALSIVAGVWLSARHDGAHADPEVVEQLRAAYDLQLAKSGFIANVGHDIRAPVQAIRHFASALQGQGGLSQPLEKIDENLSTINSMLDSLVRYTELERSSANPVFEEIQLDALFGVLQTEFEPVAARKKLDLYFDSGRRVIHSDNVLLSQVLRNLIDNAIRYTDAGLVRVRVANYEDRIHIVVEDTGRAIPEDELDRVFDEFYRSSVDGGVGLGLSIVASLTRLLGMKVLVTSVPGQGSRFELVSGETADLRDTMTTSLRETTPAARVIDFRGGAGLNNVQVLTVGEACEARTARLLETWGAEVTRLRSPDDIGKVIKIPDVVVLACNDFSSRKEILEALLKQNVLMLVETEDPVPDSESRNLVYVSDQLSAMKIRAVVQRFAANR